MTVKEYLLNTDSLNLAGIARQMWPNNKKAKVYLYEKLAGRRPWTDKDSATAKAVLKTLCVDIEGLE